MNAEIKAQWIAALRSGEYQQGQGRLRSIAHIALPVYCATGVLCDLAAAEGIGKWEGEGFASKSGFNVAILPPAVRKWADVPYGISREIGLHNDNGMPFPEIADLIEERL